MEDRDTGVIATLSTLTSLRLLTALSTPERAQYKWLIFIDKCAWLAAFLRHSTPLNQRADLDIRMSYLITVRRILRISTWFIDAYFSSYL